MHNKAVKATGGGDLASSNLTMMSQQRDIQQEHKSDGLGKRKSSGVIRKKLKFI